MRGEIFRKTSMELSKEFRSAIKQICDERGITEESVIGTIEQALAAAYRKDYGKPDQRIEIKLDPNSGKMNVWQVFEIVEDEEFDNKEHQIKLSDAKKKKKTAKAEDTIKKKLKPRSEFGRIAAQTAKQVIIQRIREAERDVVFSEFSKKEGEVTNGVVQQTEGRNVIVDIQKTNGVLFPQEQVPTERYYVGQRLKVYILKVEDSPKGPIIHLSRSHPELIAKLFTLEVPEISAGAVKIKNTVREAGSRTKISVTSTQEGVDPVGSCVGQRGNRVQAVLAEIGEEKIDIVLYDKDPATYIKNALSPARVDEVKVKKSTKQAEIKVSADQLSLAIGKDGQNVRLASKLTGYNIDILKEGEKDRETEKHKDKEIKSKKEKEDKKLKKKETKSKTKEKKSTPNKKKEPKKKNKEV